VVVRDEEQRVVDEAGERPDMRQRAVLARAVALL